MQCIVCGLGGQGVITLNALIGNLALALGLNAISAETHGMAMRGGSVYTSIKINEGTCPTVALGSADLLISTDVNETARNIKFLAPSGMVISNGKPKQELPFKGVYIEAGKIATELYGNAVHANTILLGITIAEYPELFPKDKAVEILKQNKKLNIDALICGLERKF